MGKMSNEKTLTAERLVSERYLKGLLDTIGVSTPRQRPCLF